jgi:hypothetical protein
MQTLYKFQLPHVDRLKIRASSCAVPLSVGLDPEGRLCLWMQVDPAGPKRDLDVFVVGTGNPIPPEAINFVGSVTEGLFVWHIFTSKLL